MIGLSEEKIFHQRNHVEEIINRGIITIYDDENNTAVINCNRNHSIDNDTTIDRCCYQCILCPPMFFQSKRKGLTKRLWRSRLAISQQQCNDQPPTHITPNTNCQYHPQQQQHQNDAYLPQNRYHDTGRRGIGPQQYSQQIVINGEGDENSTTSSSSSSSHCGNNCGIYSLCSSSLSPSPATTNQQNDIEYRRFRALVEKLKERQLETLCQAVEMGKQDNGNGASHEHLSFPTDCVLVPRTLMADGIEPHLIACKLWKWTDLRNATELKSIPSCIKEKDTVYACCNPQHWNRVYLPGEFELLLYSFFCQLNFVRSD